MHVHCARKRAPATAAALMLCVASIARIAAPASLGAQRVVPAGHEPPIAGTWEPVVSLGQPPAWRPFVRLGYGLDRTGAGESAGPSAALGVYQDFFNPVYGALGLGIEAYAGQRGEDLDGGFQAYLESPAMMVHAGLDLNVRLRSADPLLGVSFPLRRGGWPLAGSQVRVDWIPARSQSLVLGVTTPIRQPLAGRTRPRSVDVELPRGPQVRRAPPPAAPSETGQAVARVRESMEWVSGLHGFFWLTRFSSLGHGDAVAETQQALAAFRARLAVRDTLLPGSHTYEREVEWYHTSLERAFGLALGGTDPEAAALGRPVADQARGVTLDEVVFPYNRAVGQYKQPDRLDGLTARARARFIAWLDIEDGLTGGLDPGRRAAVLGVLDAWLDAFEDLRLRMRDLKRDSRMHWLPLALVLRPEEHRTQEEIDGLVARALRRGFRGGNEAVDIDAVRFQGELRRTLLETETYHVLWVHDYRGRNGVGLPDTVAFHQTTEGYLTALLQAVRSYDATGRFPVYLMVLDQYYYATNEGKLWLDVLERPLDHRLRLPRRAASMQRTVEALQDSLRQAVAASRRLQAEAQALGDDWIERVVKVHVNVTNPSDFSFRSRRLLRRGPPLGADNLMRDHRKIIIRDITESAPWTGEVILAGVGVGEHYATPTWDDRGLVLRGPAALEAKAAVRQVLEDNGLNGASLPAPLRPHPTAEDFSEQLRAQEASGATARVLQAHNTTGWGEKDATFVQMLLYDLVPAGTLIYVPDSLWYSYEWMAQLVSAALRGCHVWVVAPALENAPASGFLPMTATQELWTRMVLVAEEFGDLVRDAGGDLRVGFYTRSSSLDDVPALLADVDTTFASATFLRRAFPLSRDAWDVLADFRLLPAPPAVRDIPGRDAVERLPKMHRKTQLIVPMETLEALARAPELPAALQAALRTELADDELRRGTGFRAELPGAVGTGGLAHLASAYRRLRESGDLGEAPLYFLTGSVNKNTRSLALDGEVLAVVAGEWALQAYVDFFLLSGGTSWVTTVEEVDVFLPPYGALKRFLGRWLHRIL